MVTNYYFSYWLENVVASATLIASPSTLANVWIHGKTGLTSAYSCDELLEQLFGDLHLQEHTIRFANDLQKLGALEDITAFNQALHDVESLRKADPQLEYPEKLLASPQWKNLQILAMHIIESPTLKMFMR